MSQGFKSFLRTTHTFIPYKYLKINVFINYLYYFVGVKIGAGNKNKTYFKLAKIAVFKTFILKLGQFFGTVCLKSAKMQYYHCLNAPILIVIIILVSWLKLIGRINRSIASNTSLMYIYRT